jgi:putative hydrolase of the HAD superfamily
MDLSGAQVDDMVEVFRRGTADAEPYPEVMEALRRCRQVARLGLLSNTQSFDMEFLESLGISELIPIRHLSCETGFLKPEPAAFEAIQKRMGLFPGELLMVGDSWNDDVSGALEAGWSSIWINRGAWPRPEHDAEAELLELPDLARVPEAVEQLQAGARCSTCLG